MLIWHSLRFHSKKYHEKCRFFEFSNIVDLFKLTPLSTRNHHSKSVELMKRCCGVNHKHPSAESGIWNLAFKHHRKIWNFTRLCLPNSSQKDVYTNSLFQSGNSFCLLFARWRWARERWWEKEARPPSNNSFSLSLHLRESVILKMLRYRSVSTSRRAKQKLDQHIRFRYCWKEEMSFIMFSILRFPHLTRILDSCRILKTK